MWKQLKASRYLRETKINGLIQMKWIKYEKLRAAHVRGMTSTNLRYKLNLRDWLLSEKLKPAE